MHCDFQKASRNQHFQSTLLVGREGVTKNSTLLIMLTILDDPLGYIQYKRKIQPRGYSAASLLRGSSGVAPPPVGRAGGHQTRRAAPRVGTVSSGIW